MIRNPRIKSVSNDILISLNKLIGLKINDETLPAQRGRLIERYICNYMKANNLAGFDLNTKDGKDCSHFEIKSLLIKKGMPTHNKIVISGRSCDSKKSYGNSNFKDKASLILFICLDKKNYISDIRLSNFIQSELALGYYGHNDIISLKTRKISIRRKYFKSHTISIKEIVQQPKGFMYWMNELKLQKTNSFVDWFKLL